MENISLNNSNKKSIALAVVVPVYNTEKYLVEFYNSIINQTFTDFHAYIVDDGSTDNSLKLLQEISQNDPRIRIFTQTNQGASAARNHALDEIQFSDLTYEYIYLVDSDDLFENNVFEKAINALRASKSDICIFSSRNLTKLGIDAPAIHNKELLLDHDGIVNFYFGINNKYRKNPACNRFLNNKIFKYDVIDTMRFDVNQKRSNDFEFFLRILPNLHTGYLIPSIHYIYRKRKSSIGNSVKQPGTYIACLKNWSSIEYRSELEKRCIQHYFIRSIYETIGNYLNENDPLFKTVNKEFKKIKFIKKYLIYDFKAFFILCLPIFLQKFFFKKRMKRVLKKRIDERDLYFD